MVVKMKSIEDWCWEYFANCRFPIHPEVIFFHRKNREKVDSSFAPGLLQSPLPSGSHLEWCRLWPWGLGPCPIQLGPIWESGIQGVPFFSRLYSMLRLVTSSTSPRRLTTRVDVVTFWAKLGDTFGGFVRSNLSFILEIKVWSFGCCFCINYALCKFLFI